MSGSLRTRFTDLFGARHPIVCGGMTAVGTAELVESIMREAINTISQDLAGLVM